MRTVLSVEIVRGAIKSLEAQGLNPTLDRIKGLVGGGKTTILKLKKQIQQDSSPNNSPMDSPIDSPNNSPNKERADNQAAIEQLKADIEQLKAQLDKERSDHKKVIEQIKADIEQLKKAAFDHVDKLASENSKLKGITKVKKLSLAHKRFIELYNQSPDKRPSEYLKILDEEGYSNKNNNSVGSHSISRWLSKLRDKANRETEI